VATDERSARVRRGAAPFAVQGAVFDVGSLTQLTTKVVHFLLEREVYAGNTQRARLAILIHEEGHQLAVVGFQNVFGIPKAGKANDKLVDDHCRSSIEAAR
jgi:hypothetical protein